MRAGARAGGEKKKKKKRRRGGGRRPTVSSEKQRNKNEMLLVLAGGFTPEMNLGVRPDLRQERGATINGDTIYGAMSDPRCERIQ